MGVHSGDDERRRKPGQDGVGSVPAPWGEAVIPDDIAELADEAAEVRRELRRERRLRRMGGGDDTGPGIIGPLLVVLLTMTMALVSLFGGFWPRVPAADEAGEGTRAAGVRNVPDLTLSDANGSEVRLRDAGPAVILNVGRCACAELIGESAAVAGRNSVSLLVVGQPTAPDLAPIVRQTQPGQVLALADPSGALARRVVPDRAPEKGSAVVILLGGDGSMRQVMTDVRSAEEFAAGAAQLT